MDTSQDTAIAPFSFSRREIRRITAAHYLPFRFELQQCGFDLIEGKRESFRQRRDSHWPEGLHPTTHRWKRFAAQMPPFGGDPKHFASSLQRMCTAGGG